MFGCFGYSQRGPYAAKAAYDEKKKENPKWVGVPITKDQAFVIVIGPETAAAPAAVPAP